MSCVCLEMMELVPGLLILSVTLTTRPDIILIATDYFNHAFELRELLRCVLGQIQQDAGFVCLHGSRFSGCQKYGRILSLCAVSTGVRDELLLGNSPQCFIKNAQLTAVRMKYRYVVVRLIRFPDQAATIT